MVAIVNDALIDAGITLPFLSTPLTTRNGKIFGSEGADGISGRYRALHKRHSMHGQVIEVAGDSLCCQYIFVNGGSQAVNADSGLLFLTGVLLDLLTAAADDGAVVRFRWVPRHQVQDADDLSKFVDRMDFNLHSRGLHSVRSTFGPWDIDRLHASTMPPSTGLTLCLIPLILSQWTPWRKIGVKSLLHFAQIPLE